jgi:hypothetical protein
MQGQTKIKPLDKHKCKGARLAVYVSCECGWTSSNWSGTGARRSAYHEFRQHIAEHQAPILTGLTLGGLPPRLLKAAAELRCVRPARYEIKSAGRERGSALVLARLLLSARTEDLLSEGLLGYEDIEALRRFAQGEAWPLKESSAAHPG